MTLENLSSKSCDPLTLVPFMSCRVRLTLGRPSSPILVDKTVSPVSKDAPVEIDQVSSQCGRYCFSLWT